MADDDGRRPSSADRLLPFSQRQRLPTLQSTDSADSIGSLRPSHAPEGVLNFGNGKDSAALLASRPVPLIVYLYVLLAALGGLLFGLEISIISGVKDRFSDEFNITNSPFKLGLVTTGEVVQGHQQI
jgi:hypothetical protein